MLSPRSVHKTQDGVEIQNKIFIFTSNFNKTRSCLHVKNIFIHYSLEYREPYPPPPLLGRDAG